jgi:ribonuclease P protein component
MSLRFSRTVRLHARREFDAVQKGGRRVSARFATVLGRPNGLDRDRLGVIASRKVGGAVVRNRAKRRIRECFRLQQSGSALPSRQRALDVVVIARTALTTAPFADVQADLASAVRKLRA